VSPVLEAVASPGAFVASLVVFAFLPGLVLRQVVRLYPKGHSRRAELLGELYAMPQWRRPWFVMEQLETALCEGLPTRVSHGIDKVRRRRRPARVRRERAEIYRRAVIGGATGLGLLVAPVAIANAATSSGSDLGGVALLILTVIGGLVVWTCLAIMFIDHRVSKSAAKVHGRRAP
jgi:hypothetical protein